jgi:hypothetical protein
MHKAKILFSTIILAVAALVSPLSGGASAAGASLYFVPTNLIVSGSTYSVQVRVNTGGTAADAVEADFTYPTSLLTYNNTDLSSSAFSVTASSTGGGGSVSIQLGATPPYVTGDALVATVNFRSTQSPLRLPAPYRCLGWRIGLRTSGFLP